jgi:hypothetical protein
MLFVAVVSSHYPRGDGTHVLGGHLRREEQHLSRTRECVGRVGIVVDDMSEGFFSLALSP